jgi:hypothetical protein
MQREIISDEASKCYCSVILSLQHYFIQWVHSMVFGSIYIYSLLYGSGDLEQIVIQEIICCLIKRKN